MHIATQNISEIDNLKSLLGGELDKEDLELFIKILGIGYKRIKGR